MAAEAPDLPGPLRSRSAYPLAGRAVELEMLASLLPRADGEGRRVALIAGEPGVGKSRLVREFSAGAAEVGALVLYGACDAEARAPYGPFVEALDRLARVVDPAELREALGSSGELARLLPELPALLGELPRPAAADPDTERHRLHVAVAEMLADLSRRRPILLVIEDAHWADRPTLALIRHLARTAWSARLLLLVTYRDESESPELVRAAGRSAARRGRRPDPPRRAHRHRGRRAGQRSGRWRPGTRRAPEHRAGGARRRDPRPDGGQRLPCV